MLNVRGLAPKQSGTLETYILKRNFKWIVEKKISKKYWHNDLFKDHLYVQYVELNQFQNEFREKMYKKDSFSDSLS